MYKMNELFAERTTLPTPFDKKIGDRFLLLSRYETALERSMYRALSQLQQMRISIVGMPKEENGFVSQNC